MRHGLGAIFALVLIGACAGAQDMQTLAAPAAALPVEAAATLQARAVPQIGVVELEENEVFEPYGVVFPGLIWTFSNGDTSGPIDVCWERAAMEPADAQKRQWVREAITSTWQRHSGLSFVGWEQCPSGRTNGIRITVQDARDTPRVNQFGVGLRGAVGGVVLNFAFVEAQGNAAAFSEAWPFESCRLPEHLQNCIKATAIHEFGHAIALAHEQMHEETPPSCGRQISRRRTDSVTTDFDARSVMNYCREDRMQGLTLSALDIGTVQAIYCRPGVHRCGGYRISMVVE